MHGGSNWKSSMSSCLVKTEHFSQIFVHIIQFTVQTQLSSAGNKISKESHKTSSGKWCIELVAWFFQTTSRFEKWFMPICRVVRFTLWNFYAIKVSMLPLFLDCGLIVLACCVGQYGLGPFSRAVQQEDSRSKKISLSIYLNCKL